jgi:Flp pilus assembly pilin Flp
LRHDAFVDDLRMMPVGGSHVSACRPQSGSVGRDLVRRLRAFLIEDDAATMVEYALLLALIAFVCALTLLNIGTAVKTKFSSVSSCLTASSTC